MRPAVIVGICVTHYIGEFGKDKAGRILVPSPLSISVGLIVDWDIKCALYVVDAKHAPPDIPPDIEHEAGQCCQRAADIRTATLMMTKRGWLGGGSAIILQGTDSPLFASSAMQASPLRLLDCVLFVLCSQILIPPYKNNALDSLSEKVAIR